MEYIHIPNGIDYNRLWDAMHGTKVNRLLGSMVIDVAHIYLPLCLTLQTLSCNGIKCNILITLIVPSVKDWALMVPNVTALSRESTWFNGLLGIMISKATALSHDIPNINNLAVKVPIKTDFTRDVTYTIDY